MLDFPAELLEDEIYEEETFVKEEVHGENERPALHKYGPLKEGKWYHVIEEENDWFAVKLLGQRIIVPLWVFEK
jgi:hypothetical protein